MSASPFDPSPRGLLALPAARRSAYASLGELHALLGAAGLPAATATPGLLAEVDQHRAAIRDRLLLDLRPLSAVTLARYADGVLDAAGESGWRPPAGPDTDWSRVDWVTVRLLAICHLAAASRPHLR
ncbi:DUF6401 family natural product biosynthesis protein [Micromonospora sp. NBC_01813]|uniref:DUF6401 family natural product biosynthesis protein n=1 Tax=Micromonospora sp. NBC_01813 TaxID=2975988 RepID=UPI002DDA8E5F|nr:DUF6401 family natural product biosynthesis protein [Micromonospora sp. NBC_01813]WSA11068.1 DUF6401 family natural product biosynthesis protein [Micromonospora sp. NBC_01813]